jgi:lysozyme family protein
MLEGGISNDVNDRGGLTKYGISSRYYPEARDPDFTLADAIVIYKRLAFESKTVNIVAATTSYALGAAFFQMAVNLGNNRAMRLMQALLNQQGATLRIDGAYGPKTEEALRGTEMSPDELANAFRIACCGWYVSHALSSGQKQFLQGWVNRVGNNYVAAMVALEDDGLITALEQSSSDVEPTYS